MGNIQSKVARQFNALFSLFANTRKSSLAIIGLDAAGKTTLIDLLKADRREDQLRGQTLPTLGFNLEDIDICGTKIKIWDLGGQQEYIYYWHEYVQNVDGLVFMIDIADEERYETAFRAFKGVVPYLRDDLPVLFLLNKVDLLKDPNVLQQRLQSVKRIVEERPVEGHGSARIEVEGKTFRHRFVHISVRDDTNKVLDSNSNWTSQDSSVYPGFKWLLDEVRSSGFTVNRN